MKELRLQGTSSFSRQGRLQGGICTVQQAPTQAADCQGQADHRGTYGNRNQGGRPLHAPYPPKHTTLIVLILVPR